MSVVKSDLQAELAGIRIGDNQPVRLMGVINVSPESFFKGSVSSDRDRLKRVAVQMANEGADILDIGARSTAPYLKTDITPQEESDRLAEAIHVVRQVTDRPVSADTRTVLAAEAALEAGASILNDVSGLAHDKKLTAIASRYQGLILMANADYTSVRGKPLAVAKTALLAAYDRAIQAGIAPEKIVLDPGIGFFRNQAVSWDQWDRLILQQLPALRSLGRPLLIGVSRKSFIGKVLDHPDATDRLYGSLGVTAFAVDRGAHIIRTHDVAATRDAIRMIEWLKGSS